MFTVYILQCNDNKTYVGCTENLADRLKRHSDGHVPATAQRLPIVLLVSVNFDNKYKAFDFEKYLKSGSGRAFLKKHFV